MANRVGAMPGTGRRRRGGPRRPPASARCRPRRTRRARRASRARAAPARARRACRGSRAGASSTSSRASSTIRRTSSSMSCCVSSETPAAPGKSGPCPSCGMTAIGADRLAHAPAADHLARDLRQLLDVGLGAGREVAEDDLLGRAAAERDLDLREQLRARRS